jgi:hypothetical protein
MLLVKPLVAKLLGALGIGLLIAVAVLLFRVSQLRDALEAKRNELAAANARIEVQNAAVQRLEAEGRAAQARADAAVSEALRINQQQQPVVVRLQEGARRERGASERCEISEALREAEGL